MRRASLKHGVAAALVLLLLCGGCKPKGGDEAGDTSGAASSAGAAADGGADRVINTLPKEWEPKPGMVERAVADAKEALSVKVDPDKAFNMPPPIPEDQDVELKLSDAQIKRFSDRGIISAYADWCGFNAQDQSTLPFLTRERGRDELDNPNMTFATLVMRLMMQRTRGQLTLKGTCPEETKALAQERVYKSVLEGLAPDVTDPGKL
jgi:hypothetical protein